MGAALAQRLALIMLATMVVLLAASAVVDLRDRRSGPEAVARAYFVALEAGDVDGALDAIEPAAREDATPFIENSVLNTYEVRGIAVRQPSVIERPQGQRGEPTDVTIFVDITQWTDGTQWQAGPDVPLVYEDGRWYLAKPPLA